MSCQTTTNLFAGFYSADRTRKEMYEIAAIAILIAVVLDGLDGRIARITHTTSKFGAEYDSSATWLHSEWRRASLPTIGHSSPTGSGRPAAFLFAVCGALRLARFNVQIGVIDSRVFNGLPIRGAAACCNRGFAESPPRRRRPLHRVGRHDRVGRISLFMVSSIKYYSFKDLNFLAKTVHVLCADCIDSGDRCGGTSDHDVHIRVRRPFRAVCLQGHSKASERCQSQRTQCQDLIL